MAVVPIGVCARFCRDLRFRHQHQLRSSHLAHEHGSVDVCRVGDDACDTNVEFGEVS